MHRYLIALVVLLTLSLSLPALAQDLRIGTVDPARVFNEMQETKELKDRLENERKLVEAEEFQRKDRLKNLEAARNLLKPDSQEYVDAEKQLIQAAIEFEVWVKVKQAEIQRLQKQQMRTIFDKITAAVGEVAAQRGLLLVIAKQAPELPQNLEQVTLDQLRAAINQRNVLFSDPSIDISSDVVATLDAKFKQPAVAPAP